MEKIDKKELAEWGAKWLKLTKSLLEYVQEDYNIWDVKTPFGTAMVGAGNMFDGTRGAVLAHFAKRKMEEMEFRLEYRNEKIENRYLHFYLVKVGDNPARMFSNKNENEYIALFLAIREAVKWKQGLMLTG